MSAFMSSLARCADSVQFVATSLLHAVLGVIQAIFVLGRTIVEGALEIGHRAVALGLNLLRNTDRFITANTVPILVVGGIYYLYATRYQKRRKGSKFLPKQVT
ncbi:hypothetical protein PAXRUDRAFT_135872 [Paxillus rubicundulus Ve08.2h10]|uniref:Uncharacterized protein n=1 Tax=Paxillus rubicundulus Ve08.2h10 TaxID=930991 RepID=A0A0D0DHG4_9AGAM|nr:hypothetical protein PAXRUDRAFT_135872 [Paxillus rubicundulus Ve08.2h10]